MLTFKNFESQEDLCNFINKKDLGRYIKGITYKKYTGYTVFYIE